MYHILSNPPVRNRVTRFVAYAPRTNSIGQQVSYFNTATSLGTRMHLTQ